MQAKIKLTINRKEYTKILEKEISLLQYLREDLGLIGTKNGCTKGHCGTCTVIINGKAKRACIVKLSRLEGAIVETIEGVSEKDTLNFIQQAFLEEGAVQCGFCTPGMILATKALLDEVTNPSEEQIKKALKFNMCRCTGYTAIIRAVQRAAQYKNSNKESHKVDEYEGYIGQSVWRKDGITKVRGEKVFADDYVEEGMLYGKVIFSRYAHAKILHIDTYKADQLQGVVRIATAKDIKGVNGFGDQEGMHPIFVEKEAKYLGDIIAVVYATSKELAACAAQLVEVKYEKLEALQCPIEGIKDGALPVHSGIKNNIVNHVKVRKKDVEEGFNQAEVIVEGYYYTPAVEHGYLEPEACLAKPTCRGITIYTPSQGSHAYQRMIAKALALPLEDVRVIYTPCGGGFGGKEDPTIQIHAALGVMLTKRPVKIVLTREESIRISTKRHPMHMWMKHGATKEGKVVAVKSKVIADAGAYLSQSKPVVFRSAVTAPGPYEVEYVKADSYGVYTHNNPSGAFRGFGSTQVCFAAEIQMDRLAEQLNIDPIKIRRINGLQKGKVTCTGQTLGEGIGYMQTLEHIEKAFKHLKKEYPKSKVRPHKKRGYGIASSYKNVGIGSGTEDSAGAIVELTGEGRIVVKVGATDMGQGSDTVMAQIASSSLEVPYEYIDVISSDTLLCPDGGMTTASRQTFVTGNAVRIASMQLKSLIDHYIKKGGNSVAQLKDIYHFMNKNNQQTSIKYVYKPPKTHAHVEHVNAKGGDKDGIHYSYCFVSTAVAVEVDCQTGAVEVLKVVSAQDVGRAINPLNVRGQIEGSVSMGLGYATNEIFLQDDERIITDNLHKIGVPRITETPEIEAIIVEEEELVGPFGASGMGEVGVNSIAPAVANAVYDAIGKRIDSLPITKESIVE